ncbi:pyridoxamine 5'-phosphate oxidase family protein [Rhodococcus sp. RS1C4]|uniref:pyridoxamine 5'-phosphate oxidase family protein n=1 Tax=Nocardiaceae TaxID=85025 RepID=UPI00036A8FFD|nr:MULTISPECIES: pyridoxamine 5'-phosphate oxidase family protein [Rhodococcus]OZC50148.1 pyridoxamine 5'-phosphate oxidase family protein [Rhodococcus sp. RS1C4]OZC51887.1 pyridoxamine 5'-phosphate oxidase family protein [Rhodococcus sp. 06-621-2]OZD13362.1 pyridoxamine 5'-phosphate oxidase family protein [Rhodococcus sp. 06-156-3C]OZD14004.1 pyridoxamine 5'-phosphate oxidase family protein [Rhodococcus sp. 06-156-4C]OZD28709.1 pyridoxamine 5'-phosphate oxidase family protein [Rhodococcus sp.
MSTEADLSPTERTTIRRGRVRARTDRSDLADVLATARICHLGVVVDGSVRVLPTVFAVDHDGPDPGGTLYVHGSVAARSLVDAPNGEICVTVTVLDGLVLARSAFHHSMNYRSAVVYGRPRLVGDDEERVRALAAIVDQVVDGRSEHLRAHTRKELAATVVLALPLHEASVKARTGDPVDDERDVDAGGVWAGVVPVRDDFAEPTRAADVDVRIPVPEHVLALVRQF